jgi:hypothetical protein
MIAAYRNLSGCLFAALIGAAASMSMAQEPMPAPGHGHPTQAASRPATGDEAKFLAANDTAMNKMMADMTVTPSGDVDRDFVAMMVPHHQGAIDMAQLILRFGKNEQLKRLAQEIIVTQQEEIAAMRLAVGDPLPPAVPAPTQPSAKTEPPAMPAGETHHDHAPMKMNQETHR